MRYIFFGGQESKFAQIVLDDLTLAGMPPVAAIRDAKAQLDLDYLRSLNADFFLVAAFGKILKKELLEIPPKGTIGIHPSLLPKYRGASPIQTVILNGEKETGTAIFLIDEKVDHGAVLGTERLAIESDDTYSTLAEKLAHLSAGLFIKLIPKWLDGSLRPMLQDESEATFTRKFGTPDAEVDLKKDDQKKIHLKILSLNPEPGVFTILKLKNGKTMRLKILEARYENGGLVLQRVQPDGKRAMAYSDFLNGYKNLLE